MKASADEWHQTWRQGLDALKARVAARRRELGYQTQTLDQYLASRLSRNERAAGLELKWFIEREFSAAAGTRTQGFASAVVPSMTLPDMSTKSAFLQLQNFAR